MVVVWMVFWEMIEAKTLVMVLMLMGWRMLVDT